MSDDAKKKGKPGPKTGWFPSLGDGEWKPSRFPPPIHDILKEKPIRQLISWMVVDASFKQRILGQVPKEEPPEPEANQKG
jgi:hypothetical protein